MKNKGFTLIELCITLVIIAAISAVVVDKYKREDYNTNSATFYPDPSLISGKIMCLNDEKVLARYSKTTEQFSIQYFKTGIIEKGIDFSLLKEC